MSKQMFMIDIETTGVDPSSEDILQIACVEMKFDANGLWKAGAELNFFQHTDKKPENEFSKKYLKNLFQTCNQVDYTKPAEVRSILLDFFRSCGSREPNNFLCGWNAAFFDLPFLTHKQYLVSPKYIEGKMIGDFHYRIYDLNGVLNFLVNIDKKVEINPLIKKVETMYLKREGEKHDALFDCYRQIDILNGLITMAREEKAK